MRTRLRSALTLLVSLFFVAGLPACGDDGGTTEPGASFNLTFTGDETFHGAHGGDPIHVFVKNSGGSVVASASGTVSGSQVPAFSFTFENALKEGETYELNYWMDSNFEGGTPGACDSPDVDHQWKIDIGPVSNDVTIDDTHRPTETEQVCTDSEDDDTPGY